MGNLLRKIAIATGGLFVTVWVPASRAQSLFDELNVKTPELGGIRLYGVSLFGGYSTTAFPPSAGGIPTLQNTSLANLGPDESYGASATLGWQHHRDRTNISVTYSANYGGLAHNSNLNAFGQSASLSASRQLGSKWSVSLAASGQDQTMQQYLFQPTGLSVLAITPASFDDLAAAFAVGQFSNSQMASVLTGAAGLESPAQNLLLGNRVLSYSATASVSYRPNSRLSFRFGSVAAGGQRLADNTQGQAAPNYLSPHTLGLNGGAAISYALSPRTNIGVNADINRTVDRYQSAYVTNVSLSLGRKMGERWFLTVYGGGSYTHVIQQTYGAPVGQQATGGGSLGFRTHRNTLIGSYGRSASDSYGLGVGTSTTINGAWTFHSPGSSWTLFTSFGQQQMTNTGFFSFSGWQAAGGLSQTLSRTIALTAQYAYLSSSGLSLGIPTDLNVQSIRLSMSWSPMSMAH